MKKTHYFFSKVISAVAAVIAVAALAQSALAAGSAGISTMTITGTYRQTNARSMLSMINEWRNQGADMRDMDDEIYFFGPVDSLTYDYNLEKIAMQRAAELAFRFVKTHERPDGSECFTCVVDGVRSYGENIARLINYPADSTTDAYLGWREDDCYYEEQGHRRNMINPDFTAIGIACFFYEGAQYWVQEFGYETSDAEATKANDSETSVEVSYSNDFIEYDIGVTRNISDVFGTVADMPGYMVLSYVGDVLVDDITDETTATWEVVDSDIAYIDNGKVYLVEVGLTYINCDIMLDGELLHHREIPVSVNTCDINDESIIVEPIPDQPWTLEPIRPEVHITQYGRTLVEGVDYTIGYEDEYLPGAQHHVTINGIGKYYEYDTFWEQYFPTVRYIYFNVLPVDISKVEISGIHDVNYSYGVFEYTLNPTYTYDGYEIPGYMFDIEYENNTNVGTATMTITGGVYATGSTTRTFEILPADISKLSISCGDAYYTGEPVTPRIEIHMGNQWLVKDKDYTVTFTDNVEAGVATAHITGIGNYTGTASVQFNILSSGVTPTAAPTNTPTAAPTSTPNTPTQVPTATPTAAPVDELTGVRGFCERLYTCALNRDSEAAGRDWWVDALRHGTNGAEAAYGFFFSDEIVASGISDAEFIHRLYLTFMDREPAAPEMSYWNDYMADGGSRSDVFWGFIHSTEWANICLTYGILSGGNGTPTITVEPSDAVVSFATRLYTTCLGRDGEEAGVQWWSMELANLRITGSAAAQAYFFSDEFMTANVNDREFVNRLYLTFMDRDADYSEFDYWLNEMSQGMSRESVFSGFANSEEFGNICAEFGIIR